MDGAEYDVVVVGSGVAGATVGLCLGGGSSGALRVLVVEKKQHPRFAIGESTVPATTWGFTHLAETYGVGELAQLSNYVTARQRGIRTYPKCHFWFGLHTTPGLPLSEDHELVFETFRPPIGPDSHLRRDDLDAYLVAALPAYGVDYLDATTVAIDPDAWAAAAAADAPLPLTLTVHPPHARGVPHAQTGPTTRRVTARFVIDASGHAAVVGTALGLTSHSGEGMETHTRVIYGHYRYDAEVRSLDALCGGPHPAFRYHRESGTMHHCFTGGWIWVIPFEDGTLSLGVLLDTRAHPLDPSVAPAAELAALLARFPTIDAHLGGLAPTRPLYRSPSRVQLCSSTVAGPRFLLAPHAATFIDPLFSTGMLLSVRFAARALPLVFGALATDSFDAAAFAPLAATFATETAFIDKMVAGTIAATAHPAVFRQFWRVWIDGTIRHTNDAMEAGAWARPLYGSSDAAWVAAVDTAYGLVCGTTRANAAATAAELHTLLAAASPPSTAYIPYYPDFAVDARGPISVPAWVWTGAEPKVFYSLLQPWRLAFYLLKGLVAYFAVFCTSFAVASLFRTEWAVSVANVYAQHASVANHTRRMAPMQRPPVATSRRPPAAAFAYVAPPAATERR